MNRLCHPEMAKKACNMYPPYFSPFLNSISFWIMIMQSVLSYIFLLSFLGEGHFVVFMSLFTEPHCFLLIYETRVHK